MTPTHVLKHNKMKVYKLTIQIIDFDEIGSEEIKDVLENANYPNDCISPKVIEIDEREIEWTDDHPLNRKDTANKEFKRLFE